MQTLFLLHHLHLISSVVVVVGGYCYHYHYLCEKSHKESADMPIKHQIVEDMSK